MVIPPLLMSMKLTRSKVRASTLSMACCSRRESVISDRAMQTRPSLRSMEEMDMFLVRISCCSPNME